MENEESFFTASRKEVEAYLQDRLLLLKMQTAEKSSKLVATLFSSLIIAILAFFILLFISIMAGYFFASVTHSLYIGFGIVAAFYIILLILIIKLRKKVIEKKIIDDVIKGFFLTNEDDETAY